MLVGPLWRCHDPSEYKKNGRFLFVLRECSDTGKFAGFCPVLARHQARLEAEATQERRLLAVACKLVWPFRLRRALLQAGDPASALECFTEANPDLAWGIVEDGNDWPKIEPALRRGFLSESR
jgi:hypothetical protein